MKRILILFCLTIFSLSYTSANVMPHNNGGDEKEGKVSWYGPGFHGKKTASGSIYNQNKLTAAHKTLPFGTKVKITNVKNGKSVTVTINDRGPYIKGRVFDLSKAAFNKIGHINSGVLRVKYEILN